jgi:DNA-binding transcriptional MerR regulator
LLIPEARFMEYTIQKLSQMAGISTRTLRYYDEIGLLKPARINSSGYRIYGAGEVDRMQALKEHREQLLEQRAQLDLLLENVEKTIEACGGRIVMSDQDKFKGFKQKMVEGNERRYGREAREKYGDQAVDKSNLKLLNMTKEQYEDLESLTRELTEVLSAAFKTGDPAGELAQKAADLHRQWLSFYWDDYSKEAHAGVAQLYVDDERFTAYYDKEQPGTAAFLRDAILIYTGLKE